jgi:hypothetical protein
MAKKIKSVGDVGHLMGWAGKNNPQLVRDEFDLFKDDFHKFHIVGSAPIEGARSMLWEVSRKVLGKDTENFPQEVGDCVSFGGKNATEYVQFYPIVNGDANEFKNIFPPYLYGCGRVFIGKGQVNGDGSLGVWQAKAVMEYGAIPTDTPNCPKYSGNIARKWGDSGPPDEFVSVGKTHIVKSAALISSWDELVTALVNGYPVTVASDIGYDMKPRSDGFHHNSTSWGHQMCFIGVDNRADKPYACILNSWGDVHGEIKDFKTGENWPVGTLRVLKSDAEKMIKQGDTFAYSSFNAFPAQKLPRSFFDLF